MKRFALLFLLLGLMGSCGGGGSKTSRPAISVSLAPSTQMTIDQGQSVSFTATLTNDSNNQGVTWNVSGTGCAGAACGTLTDATATAAKYNAPTPVSSSLTVTVTATSAADTTKSASSTVVVNPAPSITTTSLPSVTVGTAYSATLAATGGTGTLTWSLTAGSLPAGLSLASTGTISGTPTATGTSTFMVRVTDSASTPLSAQQQLSITINNPALTIITESLLNGSVNTVYNGSVAAGGGASPYTWSLAAGSLPAGLLLNPSTGVISGTPTATGTAHFTVQVTDSSTPTAQTATKVLSFTINAAAAACGSGNESILSGQYAFSLSGFNAWGFLAVVGSFTADGSGHITAGEVDTNGILGAQQANITTSLSSYSVGSDKRGCATIATSFGTFTTRFALGSLASNIATEGRVIGWETGSRAYIASGTIRKQTPADFSAGPSGNFAFSGVGVDRTAGRFGAVGVMTANDGSFSNGEEDVNSGGSTNHITGITGIYGSVDANGRFTGSTVTPSDTVPLAFYMVSSSEMLFVMTEDDPIGVGELRKQTGTFSNSSVNGNMVAHLMGLSSSTSGGAIEFGLVSSNGSGSLTATIYGDEEGTWQTPNPNTSTCTYSVATNGRMALSGCGSETPLFYLTAANTAFMLSPDTGVRIGQVEPQTGGPFNSGSLSGTFYMGTIEVVSQGAEIGVGAVTLDGSGGVSVTNDYTSTTYQQPDQTGTDTITVNADGTFSDSEHPGLVTGIIISGTKVVVIDNPSRTYPTISVIMK